MFLSLKENEQKWSDSVLIYPNYLFGKYRL
jgi:hypothetical protein